MLFPNFNERAEEGYLTISSNTMNNTDPVEFQIEDKDRRLVVNLAIEPHHLMRALMNRGNMPCKFIVLKASELPDEKCPHCGYEGHSAADCQAYRRPEPPAPGGRTS